MAVFERRQSCFRPQGPRILHWQSRVLSCNPRLEVSQSLWETPALQASLSNQ